MGLAKKVTELILNTEELARIDDLRDQLIKVIKDATPNRVSFQQSEKSIHALHKRIIPEVLLQTLDYNFRVMLTEQEAIHAKRQLGSDRVYGTPEKGYTIQIRHNDQEAA